MSSGSWYLNRRTWHRKKKTKYFSDQKTIQFLCQLRYDFSGHEAYYNILVYYTQYRHLYSAHNKFERCVINKRVTQMTVSNSIVSIRPSNILLQRILTSANWFLSYIYVYIKVQVILLNTNICVILSRRDCK